MPPGPQYVDCWLPQQRPTAGHAWLPQQQTQPSAQHDPLSWLLGQAQSAAHSQVTSEQPATAGDFRYGLLHPPSAAPAPAANLSTAQPAVHSWFVNPAFGGSPSKAREPERADEDEPHTANSSFAFQQPLPHAQHQPAQSAAEHDLQDAGVAPANVPGLSSATTQLLRQHAEHVKPWQRPVPQPHQRHPLPQQAALQPQSTAITTQAADGMPAALEPLIFSSQPQGAWNHVAQSQPEQHHLQSRERGDAELERRVLEQTEGLRLQFTQQLEALAQRLSQVEQELQHTRCGSVIRALGKQWADWLVTRSIFIKPALPGAVGVRLMRARARCRPRSPFWRGGSGSWNVRSACASGEVQHCIASTVLARLAESGHHAHQRNCALSASSQGWRV